MKLTLALSVFALALVAATQALPLLETLESVELPAAVAEDSKLEHVRIARHFGRGFGGGGYGGFPGGYGGGFPGGYGGGFPGGYGGGFPGGYGGGYPGGYGGGGYPGGYGGFGGASASASASASAGGYGK